YSILKTGTPLYLADGLKFYSRPRDTSRVSPLDPVVPNCRTSAYQHSFAYAASLLWNSLPRAVRESESLTSFRHALFCHLRRRVV
ncbi:hypothetical protein ALC57_05698, partial [Trachymyrmex cornetzi]